MLYGVPSMKPFTQRKLLAPFVLSALYISCARAESAARTIADFNAHWKLQRGNMAPAEQPTLDDSAWRGVTVPHDWSIAGPVDKANPSGQGGGYFPTGVARYRKSFSLSAKYAHRRVYVDRHRLSGRYRKMAHDQPPVWPARSHLPAPTRVAWSVMNVHSSENCCPFSVQIDAESWLQFPRRMSPAAIAATAILIYSSAISYLCHISCVFRCLTLFNWIE